MVRLRGVERRRQGEGIGKAYLSRQSGTIGSERSATSTYLPLAYSRPRTTQNKYDVYIVAPNTYWTMTPLLASAASECSTTHVSFLLIDPMLICVATLPPSAGSLEFRNVVGKSDLARPISKIGRPQEKRVKPNWAAPAHLSL